jgi:subtilase family serine protease
VHGPKNEANRTKRDSSHVRVSAGVRTGVTGLAQGTTVLKGNHPVEAETLGPVVRADANLPLNMPITFALRNRAELERLLSDLQNPTSPQFHHWLSPAEFNRRFGPRDADVAAVVDWLRTEGFNGISVNRAGRSVSFSGTVAQAERTFTVSIATFGKSQVFANINDPVIPARFAEVIAGIHGLDNMARVVPLSHGSPQFVPAPAPSSLGSQSMALALSTFARLIRERLTEKYHLLRPAKYSDSDPGPKPCPNVIVQKSDLSLYCADLNS